MNLDVVARYAGLSQLDLQHRSQGELQKAREELRAVRDSSYEASERILRSANGRSFTNPQARDYDVAVKRMQEAGEVLEAVEESLAQHSVDLSQILSVGDGMSAREMLVGSRDGYRDGAPLTRSQTMTGFARSQGLVEDGEENLSLRKFLRGSVLGEWDGADAERRAMSEGVLAGGGYLLPTILSTEIIDLARNQTRVLQAGARLVPMANKSVDIARWEGDPTLAWHTENASIAASDAVLGKVSLVAKSLAGRVVFSRELLEDASGIDDAVRNAFAQQLALTIDRVSLYGSGTDPEPRGVKNTSGITVRSLATDGADITSFAPLVTAVSALRDLNEEPNGILYSPRTERRFGYLTDSTGQPLNPPPYIADVPRYRTAQVPNNLTQGANSDASDIFAGDWTKLAIGVRTQLQLEVLRERYADNGQVGLLAWWRGDVAVLRPKSFHVTVGARDVA